MFCSGRRPRCAVYPTPGLGTVPFLELTIGVIAVTEVAQGQEGVFDIFNLTPDSTRKPIRLVRLAGNSAQKGDGDSRLGPAAVGAIGALLRNAQPLSLYGAAGTLDVSIQKRCRDWMASVVGLHFTEHHSAWPDCIDLLADGPHISMIKAGTAFGALCLDDVPVRETRDAAGKSRADEGIILAFAPSGGGIKTPDQVGGWRGNEEEAMIMRELRRLAYGLDGVSLLGCRCERPALDIENDEMNAGRNTGVERALQIREASLTDRAPDLPSRDGGRRMAPW